MGHSLVLTPTSYRSRYNPAMPDHAPMPMTLAANRSLNRIASASRGELCKRAVDLCETPWIREAFVYATDRDVRLLGRFDLVGSDRRTPWPAVLIEVRRRPRNQGQTDRRGLVAVYINLEGEWEASDRESDKIPVKQYRGDRDGLPSVLNGDAPGELPEAEIGQP